MSAFHACAAVVFVATAIDQGVRLRRNLKDEVFMRVGPGPAQVNVYGLGLSLVAAAGFVIFGVAS